MSRVHIVGAGLAGLAAATAVVEGGGRAVVYEAARRAGGRCRSFFEPALGRTIDNGNHLMLGGNRAIHAYLATVGAADALVSAEAIVFPFVDLATGDRWVLRPNRGRLPWWLLVPGRRVPGTRARDYLAAARALAHAPAGATVAAVLGGSGPAYARLWEPLAVGVLNAAADEGAAALLAPVLAETLGRGGEACRPLVARAGLSPALVEPALAWLAAHGAEVRLGARLRRLAVAGARVTGLGFGDAEVTLAPGERVILAVPPERAAALVAGLVVPRGHRAIVNAHFRLAEPPGLAHGSPLLGLIGGLAQWLFVRGDVVSLTVSAGDRLLGTPAEALAARLWGDAATALGRAATPLPPHRIVKERRATFAQTPAEIAHRPGPETALANLVLAGDWTATGLPATIEGAVRSGHRAARLALASAR